MNIYDYIIAPVVTEKSINAQKENKYIFKIRKGVNKIEAAKAISKIYNVKVLDVRKLKLPVKTRLFKRGQTVVKRPQVIKIIVTLDKNQSIDFVKTKESK